MPPLNTKGLPLWWLSVQTRGLRNKPSSSIPHVLFMGQIVLSSSCAVICALSLHTPSISAQAPLSLRLVPITSLLSWQLSLSPCCYWTLSISVLTLRTWPAFSCFCPHFSSVLAAENYPLFSHPGSFCRNPGCGVRKWSPCLSLFTDWLCSGRSSSQLLVWFILFCTVKGEKGGGSKTPCINCTV